MSNTYGIVVNGKQFSSITEACKYFNITLAVVRSRMASTGETPEQAINYYLHTGVRQHSQPVVVNGKQFDSIKDACTYFNVSYGSVLARTKAKGETPEQSINYYFNNSGAQVSKKVVTVNGKQFGSIKDACTYFNVQYGSVLARTKSAGETPEQAIDFYINQRVKSNQHAKAVTVNGKQFILIKDACTYFNVQYGSVRSRINLTGETPEQAINFYIKQRVKSNQHSQPVVVNGKQFKSIAEACRCFNVSYGTVRSRINLTGETLEQVINYYLQHGVKNK